MAKQKNVISLIKGWPTNNTDAVKVEYTSDGCLRLTNDSNEKAVIRYKRVTIYQKDVIQILFRCNLASVENAGGTIQINSFEIAMNGETTLPVEAPFSIEIKAVINANSSVTLSALEAILLEEPYNICETIDSEPDVLVVVPAYPTYGNLYMSAFAHARNRAYVEAGLKVQVAYLQDTWYQMKYSIDGVPVYAGPQSDLKTLISRKQYKTIVIHFVDEWTYPVLDGYISNERLIFICHGPETSFEIIPNKARGYFTKPLPEIVENPEKRGYVRKYAKKKNVNWVFVSEWLKEESEKLLDVKFENAHVIGNLISEKLFPYCEKKAEDRKKILVIRKFDDFSYHSIDQVVFTIRELSRRPFFDDLEFSIYGDGDRYDELVAPIRSFNNITFHRTFLPQNEISGVHREHGILLIPSRHDAHAVSMSEGASSGLVVVGSNVTSNPYYMDDTHNHILADPEDPIALADILERLYYNPEEFLQISKRLSDYVHTVSSKEKTIDREIELIRKSLSEASLQWNNIPQIAGHTEAPVLTVMVAAYNVEPWLDKCLRSLIDHRNASRMEVLVVNDGSKDRTSEIAHKYEKATNGVVRVIDKENGGHGSTINTGIKEAKGKYFRIVDGDDWVDSDNLATLIDKLETDTADVVLTPGSYDYSDSVEIKTIVDYSMFRDGILYKYDDLLFPGYGFDNHGPVLSTSTYRTECLRNAGFLISEKRPYVDMEFNAFSQRYIQTLRYYDLDIYRYLIGREGQTVSKDFWKRKYRDHEYIIFNILKTLDDMPDYPDNRKRFVYKHLIAMMVDSQIFMFDQVGKREEIDAFLEELGKWPEAKAASLDYIRGKNVESQIILENYKTAHGSKPIIRPDGRMRGFAGKGFVKKCLKAATPYGLLWARRKIISRG